MNVVGNILRGRFEADITGLPAPVHNVTVSATRSDRAEALHTALIYHQDENVGPEIVCNTAMVFEYYLQHGEYPAG